MTGIQKPTWEQFVTDNLLKSGIFSGLALVATDGNIIYSHGCLHSIEQEDIGQFVTAFEFGKKVTTFKLTLSANNPVKTIFRIYYQNHISVYATAAGNHSGLTLSRLPQGIFITVFNKPALPHQAICTVEHFSEKLRF